MNAMTRCRPLLAATAAGILLMEDLGNGDPDGDGAYRKTGALQEAHSGAVYVVNGSGSEVRPATLNHPGHVRGLLTAGSMLIDVDASTLTARFLSSTGTVDDQFRIVKGSACPPAPASGCGTAARGQFRIRRDAWSWKWKGGTIDPVDVGDPGGETDVAVCVYDATGSLVGGEIPHGAAQWKTRKRGVEYRDPLLTRHGLQKVKIRTGTGSLTAYVQAKAKGPGASTPTTALTTPITAQLVNLDTGACWSSQFTSTSVNLPGKVKAVFP
jgi:hypothetical protein